MGCFFTANNLIDAIGMGIGAMLDYAIAQGPALVFVEGSPDMLLDANFEVFLGITSCDAHIALVSHAIGDDIYYMASV
jgi:hypothetical protein